MKYTTISINKTDAPSDMEFGRLLADSGIRAITKLTILELIEEKEREGLVKEGYELSGMEVISRVMTKASPIIADETERVFKLIKEGFLDDKGTTKK